MGIDKRAGDRRNGDRRGSPRAGPDRRRGDRRVASGLGVLSALLVVSVPRTSSAQIYTRTNSAGVVEATNLPERPGDYRLAYPKRFGVVMHSPGFLLRPSNHSAYNEFITSAAALHEVDVALV